LKTTIGQDVQLFLEFQFLSVYNSQNMTHQLLSSGGKMNENSSEIDRGPGPQKVIRPQHAAGRSNRDASQRSSIKTVAVAREVANWRQTWDRVLVLVDSNPVRGVNEAVPARVDWVVVSGDCVFVRVALVFMRVDCR
jgi:hypothetical protein